MSNRDKVKMQIARVIVGPRFDLPADDKKRLEMLRDKAWEEAGKFRQDDALNAAEGILREMHVFPRKERVSQKSVMQQAFDGQKKIV